MDGGGRRHGLRATAVLFALLGSTALVQAQDATWVGTVGPPNNWNTAANWAPTPSGPPPYVPTGTAFFNASLSTATTIDIAGVTFVGGMTFTGAPGYTFTVPGTLILNGAGVIADAASAPPTFSTSGGAGIVLLNSATAGPSVIGLTGGGMTLLNTSTAGSATITNDATINFQDASNGGTATIFNNATQFVQFNSNPTALSASAGHATIDNSGIVLFFNSSTSGNSTIITRSGATTLFLDQSTAGASQQNVLSGGALTLQNSANAGSSTITNSGTVNFNDTSNAGTAHIVNNTGGFVFFNQAAGSASAANATIDNSAVLVFSNTSTAANATITTKAGGNTIFNGGATGGTAAFVIEQGLAAANVNISAVTAPTFTIGSLAGPTGFAGQFQIGGKNLIVGTNNQSTSYGGVLFDTGAGGSMTKTGTGTLTLAGIGSYTGATTILDGGLSVTGQLLATSSILVGNAGTLSGNGTITTAGTTTINGTLAPTAGGLTPLFLNSNLLLNPTATYRSTVGNNTLGFAVVNGAVTLGGALQVQLGANGANFGTAYTVLQSNQALSQQFNTVSGPGSLSMQVSYNPNNVQVSFQPDLVNFAAPGNANQRATANALQTGLSAGGSTAGPFGPLFNMDRATYLTALSQLSGEIATGGSTTGLRTMDLFLNHMLNPFLDARGLGSQGPSIAFAPEQAQEGASDIALGYKQGTAASNEATRAFAQLRRRDQADGRFNIWASGYGAWGKTEGDATAGSAALDTRITGGVMGLDYRPSFNSVFGLAVGGAKTSYGLAGNLGSGEADILQLGGYGAVRMNDAYVSAAFAYGLHTVTTTRTVALLSSDPIRGSYDGHSINGRVETGIRSGAPNIGITPFAAVQTQRFFAPAYQETATGSGAPFTLSYNGGSTNSVRSELGVSFDAQAAQELRFRSRVAWAHQYADAPVATAAFMSIPSGPFVVTGTQAGRDALLASVAADLLVQRGVALTGRFDTEQARGSASYAATGGVRFIW